MNIALIHYRVGETDGVSLEMDKWRKVLEKMGHRVLYIAGSKGTCEAEIIPELNYRDDFDLMLNEECYEQLNAFNPVELEEAIRNRSEIIELQLVKLIKKNDIHILVPNNLLCLGRSIHIAMALINAIKKTGVKVVAHHHDFYWERDYFKYPTTDFVRQQLKKCFPPIEFGEQMKHVVINTPAKRDLKIRKGLDATVVPNVFDFKEPLWKKDDYNLDFKKDLGVDENQILLLQATRVTNRKAIELAIDIVARLNDPINKEKMMGKELYDGRLFNESTEYVLVLVGLHEGKGGYEKKLVSYAKEKGIHMIVKPELVDHSRCLTKKGEKVYALWDAYVYCDLITYPSIYEGWGNQFLEGLFAKKPQIVFEYSIFESDIKDKGFHIISLGNTYQTIDNGLVTIDHVVLEKAVNKIMVYLTNKKLYQNVVEENFKIGAQFFSMEALVGILDTIF